MVIMKKLLTAITAVAAVLAISSCNKENEATTVSTVSVSVQLPEDFPAEAVFEGKVTANNKTTGESIEAQASAGVAEFKKVPFGVYDFSASWSLSGEEFAAIAPGLASVSVSINGVASEIVLSKDQIDGAEVEIKTVWSVAAPLIFSRIYNFGTLNLAGKPYSTDKYLEIFNNSDEVQYLDGLYIGEAWGDAITVSMFDGIASSDSLYMRRISKFPGSGNEYPVQPGKSVVVAMNAKNHIDAEVVVNTVDLSGAEFECYVDGAASFFPADNAEVPNLVPDIYQASSFQAKFFVSQGFIPVLFKSSESEIASYDRVIDPSMASFPQYAGYALKVPAKNVIDAVDLMRTGFESRGGKHVPTAVDAGFAMINQCSVAARKIARTVGGRIYLSDTNNSTNDFVELTSEAADGKHLVPKDYSDARIQPAE